MISKSSDLLLNSLTHFYDKYPNHRKTLENIIEGKHTISLRVMDWFITHYAKYKNILYWIDDTVGIYIEHVDTMKPSLRKFHLYLDYRAQLRSYTKLYFDPFRRHERISFVIEKKPLTVVETTIGQLNFFRWIFQNHILDYLLKHQAEIEKAMNQFQSKKKLCGEGLDKQSVNHITDIIPKQSRGQSKPITNTFIQSQCFLRFD
uniref:Uncharacterized protein n=1 Tax=viral metagenome TaxID=1070528 RepID=A0A6C0CU65_9ZZZZ